MEVKNKYLILAAICSGVAALLHIGCIIFGASWYRFFGAGEQMAQMAEAGEMYPSIVTGVLVIVLAIWSLYALSGAGVIFRLPLLRLGLCVISAVYFVRGLAFIPMMQLFPDNNLVFWLVSSSICLAFGALYAVGTKQSWSNLGAKNA